eukprot:scaffold323_cov414-Prasinococcus_capsulatus_cf.AAC.42
MDGRHHHHHDDDGWRMILHARPHSVPNAAAAAARRGGIISRRRACAKAPLEARKRPTNVAAPTAGVARAPHPSIRTSCRHDDRDDGRDGLRSFAGSARGATASSCCCRAAGRSSSLVQPRWLRAATRP